MATAMRKSEIANWDDERSSGDGIMVTVKWGRSFEPNEHQGVRGFDTPAQARAARTYACRCAECQINAAI